jgi:glutaredoxin 3
MEKIKIYSMEGCPWCVRAKEFFEEKNVDFEVIEVDKDKKALEEMMKETGQSGVPQIKINGKMIVGFDQGAIEAELKKGA